MNKLIFAFISTILGAIFFTNCGGGKNSDNEQQRDTLSAMELKVNEYAEFELNSDLSKLSEKEKQMIPILIEAAQIMDELFWIQAFGDKNSILDSIKDEAARKFVTMNYGPWERLKDNEPFITSYGTKPLGANFYPKDITKEEFEAFTAKDKSSLYTMIRRDSAGKLISVPYHVFFEERLKMASGLLFKAAGLAEDQGLKKYLTLRAAALLNDDFFASDMAWMDMKTNMIDFVVGPIENYEDALNGYKAAYEAYVLIKDKEWSEKLAKYSALLPELQKGLPVDGKYKKESPGSSSDLNAYDVVYYAGDCNAGGKTIAINLPNDEKVQLEKGSRRLQLKNAMKAKFDKILVPIAKLIIDSAQQNHIKFNSFFENTMFHEVAHGLGIKNTINGKGTVREALKENYSAIEEAKADILGLYLVTKLQEMGQLDIDIKDNYVTYVAGIFRSIRFGGASSHGKANLIAYNYFTENGVFSINKNGTYTVNIDKMKTAINSLSGLIIISQGDGDFNGVTELIAQKGIINDILKSDLERISKAGIPRDIVFKQGKEVLGL
jgi:hypothetical protein